MKEADATKMYIRIPQLGLHKTVWFTSSVAIPKHIMVLNLWGNYK